MSALVCIVSRTFLSTLFIYNDPLFLSVFCRIYGCVVIGCDGVKSVCKELIETGSISKNRGASGGSAVYSGIRVKYAIHDQDADENETKKGTTATLTQYFGNGAFALDGTYGAGPNRPVTRSAFLVYLDPDYIGPFRKKTEQSSKPSNQNKLNRNDYADSPLLRVFDGTNNSDQNSNNKKMDDENADWTQTRENSLEEERAVLLATAKAAGIPMVQVGPTMDKANRIFSLGVYFHNPLSLQGWHTVLRSKTSPKSAAAHVVLLGDAAHALPPFLGQGSNQAIQDAYCLATQLYQYNARVYQEQHNQPSAQTVDKQEDEETHDLSWYLKQYETIRWRATIDIFWKSLFLGYLETGGTDGLYAKFRDVFFKTMGAVGVAEKILVSAAIPKVMKKR